jgi:hypothetical protein
VAPELVLDAGRQRVTVVVVGGVTGVERVREWALAWIRHCLEVEVLRGPVLPAVAHAVEIGVPQTGIRADRELGLAGQKIAVLVARDTCDTWSGQSVRPAGLTLPLTYDHR